MVGVSVHELGAAAGDKGVVLPVHAGEMADSRFPVLFQAALQVETGVGQQHQVGGGRHLPAAVQFFAVK